jgi:GNAT superfamily N-acetyltransferase
MKKLTLLKFLFIPSFFSLNNTSATQDTLNSCVVNINGNSYNRLIKMGEERVIKATCGTYKTQRLDLTLSDNNHVHCGEASGFFGADKTFHLEGLSVEEAMRHKGLGTYLMQQIFTIAQQKNMEQVHWSAHPFETPTNPEAMQRLVTWYQGLGGAVPHRICPDWTPMHYIIKNPYSARLYMLSD